MSTKSPFQLHHDFAVAKAREEWFLLADDRDFRIARAREATGEVQPLSMSCDAATLLIDQYFHSTLPSSDDFRLRLRDAILEDVLGSHVKHGRGDACANCGRYLAAMMAQHLGE